MIWSHEVALNKYHIPRVAVRCFSISSFVTKRIFHLFNATKIRYNFIFNCWTVPFSITSSVNIITWPILIFSFISIILITNCDGQEFRITITNTFKYYIILKNIDIPQNTVNDTKRICPFLDICNVFCLKYFYYESY